jgi:hypothetical protein
MEIIQKTCTITTDGTDDISADLAFQKKLIECVTSDDLAILRSIGVKTALKPHQKVCFQHEFHNYAFFIVWPQEGVVFALNRAFQQNTGTAIFDATGLGKTFESIAIMCCLKLWRPQNGVFAAGYILHFRCFLYIQYSRCIMFL